MVSAGSMTCFKTAKHYLAGFPCPQALITGNHGRPAPAPQCVQNEGEKEPAGLLFLPDSQRVIRSRLPPKPAAWLTGLCATRPPFWTSAWHCSLQAPAAPASDLEGSEFQTDEQNLEAWKQVGRRLIGHSRC